MLEKKVTIGNTSTSLLDENLNRLDVSVTNPTDEEIRLAYGPEATMSGEEVVIGPNGYHRVSGGYTGPLSAICAAGEKEIKVIEV